MLGTPPTRWTWADGMPQHNHIEASASSLGPIPTAEVTGSSLTLPPKSPAGSPTNPALQHPAPHCHCPSGPAVRGQSSHRLLEGPGPLLIHPCPQGDHSPVGLKEPELSSPEEDRPEEGCSGHLHRGWEALRKGSQHVGSGKHPSAQDA